MSSRIHRLRRRKQESDGDPEFQVAPMVDVLLVLLLFFMSITSTEILKKEKNLILPNAKNAKEKKDKKTDSREIVLNITWDIGKKVASFSIDGNHYASAEELQPVLQARTAANPNAYVLVRADKDVAYSNIADVMSTCATSGISTVTFSVITGGDKPKTPPSQTDN